MAKKRRIARFISRRKLRTFAVESFETAKGDEFKAKELFDARCRSYGMDPVTIASLIISLIRFWLWLKEKGFLGKVPREVCDAYFRDNKDFHDQCGLSGIEEEDE
jgi:hypothetical protein